MTTTGRHPTPAEATVGPLGGRDREPVLDVLRGFAVLGILLANIEAFVDPGYLHQVREQHGLDALARQMAMFLVESKFYVLFAFLFGYGMAMQLARPSRSGSSRGARISRRLLLLFALGAVHGTLLFSGDILMIYAIAGSLLYLMRHISPRRALQVAIGLLTMFTTMMLLAVLAGAGEESGDEPYLAARVLANYRGGVGTVIGQRVEDLSTIMSSWWTLIPIILAYFLIGLAAGKTGLLHKRRLSSRTLARACAIGLAVGLPPAAVFAFASDGGGTWTLAMDGVGYLTAPALTLAYVCALLLLGRTTVGARVHTVLATTGRMALTNYLSQSVICALLFTGYGLALAGQIGHATTHGIAVLIYLTQLAWSRWWLRRHNFGPVEWLLRSFTYLRWQQWRPATPTSAPAKPQSP
ncbi:DUF418 domain-containing protein [Streptoalloteichus hindustanus]|uniref:DUF418 domain-containing protein n=1 Tax=Streptoalloteichus hindustanus TaxID=2017 RepID=A0A1M5HZX1_STRHI|nr:DUF418 domain-containing protein [Streptoalloteichus hindustanus]SHG21515.1 uncharacterized protein SAMN05444320_10734 [Streptoalloteichus hindustanus]